MVDLVKALNQDKPKPLAKKSQELGVPQPTQPNIAQGVADTDKSAQMAASPQAQKSAQQKQMRQADVQSSQAKDLRDQNPELQTTYNNAQNMITSIADNMQNIDWSGVMEGADASAGYGTPGARGTQAALSGEELTAEDFKQQGEQAFEDFLSGEDFSESFTITATEMAADDQFTEILEYAKNYPELLDTEGNLDPNVTFQQIKDEIDGEINELSEVVDTHRDVVNDPNATPAERQEASRILMDLGASHLLATDAELGEFQKDIETVDVIEFGGQTFKLKDLQDNDAVMAMISSDGKNFVDDPNHVPEWAEDYPGMWDFVKNNANAIVSTFYSEDEDGTSAWQQYEKTKKVVDDNRQVTESLGGQITGLLGLGKPSDKPVAEAFPGVKLFSSEYITSNPNINPEEARDALQYLANVDPDIVESIMKDPNFEEKLPGLVRRVSTEKRIDEARSFSSLADAFNLDIGRLDATRKDILINPDQYSDEQRQFIEAFYRGSGQLKELLKDTNFSVPEFGKTFSQKVADNAKNMIKETGLDFKNIVDNPTYKFNKDNSINALRKVNGLLKEIQGLNSTHPQVGAYVNNLKRIQKELKRYASQPDAKVTTFTPASDKQFVIPGQQRNNLRTSVIEGSKSDKTFVTTPTWATLQSQPEVVDQTIKKAGYDPNNMSQQEKEKLIKHMEDTGILQDFT